MKLFVRSLIVGALGVAPAVVAGAAFAYPGAVGAPMPAPALPGAGGFPQAPALPQPAPNAPETGQMPGAPAMPTPSPTTAEEPKQASEAQGFVRLVEEALSQIKLEPQQTAALQAIGSMVNKKEAAVHKAKIELIDALAGQIEKGSIDEKALAPQIEAFVEASESARPIMRAAFDELHDLLDPSQRQQFAEALDRGVNERQKAYAAGTWLDQWAKDFGLSSDQESQIRSAVEKLKPAAAARAKELDKVIDAFKGDKFSIDDVSPAADTAERATAMVKGLVGLTEAVSGVLTPEQRTQAASKIREKIAQPATQEPAAPSNMGTTPSTPYTAPSAPAMPGVPAAPALPGVHVAPTSANDDIGTSSDALWAGARGGAVGYRGGAVGYRGGAVGYRGGVGYGGYGGVGYGRSVGYASRTVGGYGYPAFGGVGYVL